MADLRTRIRAGDTLIGVFSDLASPFAAELCGEAGFDWIVLDLEHGAATESDLLALLYAVGTTPMAPIVRPQSSERLRVGRALDLGAAGIMLPQLQSIDEVRTAVGYLRYPPAGQRGVALRTRGARLGTIGHADIARVVNEQIVGLVQIESTGALAAADEIAALDGVDVLFVGPADLTHNLGIPGRFDDAAYLDALRAVVAACRAHGKAAGILIYDAAGLPPLLDLGFKFIGLGSEGAFVSSGARATLAAAGRAASA
ncbi:MAG TPA: aldolase/citrate lyase family protein [Candidatus Limnocylindrales bacterium]|jgi:4-hydroxy-2-oxoheptanedioate aldolase|nr:aldolase/citrate lyase family protein [Candidatus Limnocylindrales bacterium]